MELNGKIKEFREKVGLTQEELADKMGVQRNTVWRWENQRANLKADNIRKLSEILKVDPSVLIKEENKDNGRLGLEYWGKVIDSVRGVALRKDEGEILEVSQMLKMGLSILDNLKISSPTVSAYNGNNSIYSGNNLNTGVME